MWGFVGSANRSIVNSPVEKAAPDVLDGYVRVLAHHQPYLWLQLCLALKSPLCPVETEIQRICETTELIHEDKGSSH